MSAVDENLIVGWNILQKMQKLHEPIILSISPQIIRLCCALPTLLPTKYMAHDPADGW